jgi:hypothetical protein
VIPVLHTDRLVLRPPRRSAAAAWEGFATAFGLWAIEGHRHPGPEARA